MAIYLGTNELGGGKAPVGTLVYNAAATGDTYVDSNGQTLLKTGVVETDSTVYPDLGLAFATTESYDNANNAGFGGYTYNGVEWDSINNKPLYRGGSYSNMDGYHGYVTIDETDDRFEFTQQSSFHTSKEHSSAPFTDGTTHYVARAVNNGTYSSSSGPRRKQTYDNPYGTNDLDIYMSPVTTYSDTLSEAITFASSGEIQLSGTPDSGYGHWPGNFIKTSNYFYATGWVNPSGYGYSSNLNANNNIVPITYRYNGTTGAYVATMTGEQIFADPTSPSNRFYSIKSVTNATGAPRQHSSNGPAIFTLTRYNDSNGTPVAETTGTFTVLDYYYTGYLPIIWADNYGCIYHFKSHRRGTEFGTGKKIEFASGVGEALYTRGLTEDVTATSADVSTAGSPMLTSEVVGKRLYVVAK